jgi:hypothetical protein
VKRNLFAMIWLSLMIGCAIENRAPGNDAESFDSSQQELAKDAQLSAAASLIWDLDSTESCLDFFGGPCTATMPSQQRPSVRQGQPCSVENSFCTRVRGKFWDLFICR